MTVTGTVDLLRLENRIIKATLSMLQNSILCTKDEMNLSYRASTGTVSFYSDGTFYENIPLANLTINGIAIPDETTFDTQVGLLFKDALEDDVNELINSLDIMTIATVLDFAPLQPKAAIKVIIVRDTVRGGEFRRYDGAYATDNGIVFIDANGQKWFRRIKDNCVNVLWFGMVAAELTDGGGGASQNAIMDKVFTAANNREVIEYPNIYFPAKLTNDATDTFGYHFSSPIYVNFPCNLFGDSSRRSIVDFREGSSGLIIAQAAAGTTISDLQVRNQRELEGIIETNPQDCGILISGRVTCKNVLVAPFEAHGFLISASLGEGDARNSYFENCSANYNGLHGFYIQGNQASECTFINCKAISNGGVGFNSQIQKGGNTFINCYAQGNGSSENLYQRTIVSWAGFYWQCISDINTGLMGDQEPSMDNTKWQKLDNFFAGDSYVNDWTISNEYYKGGGFDIDQDNLPDMNTEGFTQLQTSTLINCITAKDQPPSYTSSKTVVIGGQNESNGEGDYQYLNKRFFNNIGVDNEIIKEIEFTTNSTSQVIISRDFYLNRAVNYEVDILAVAPGFDIWRTKKFVTITGRKGVNATAVKENITLAGELKNAGINTAAFGTKVNDGNIGIYNCALYVTGIAGTTIHWKIHIKKMYTSPNF